MAALKDCHDFVPSSSAPLQAAARHLMLNALQSVTALPAMCLSQGPHSHQTCASMSDGSATSRKFIADKQPVPESKLQTSNQAAQHQSAADCCATSYLGPGNLLSSSFARVIQAAFSPFGCFAFVNLSVCNHPLTAALLIIMDTWLLKC